MNEKYNPQKEWEQKIRDKEARYNQILLLLRNNQKEMAKRKNYEHLSAIIKKQNINKGDRVTIEYFDEESIDDNSRIHDQETGKFIKIDQDEVVLAGIESDFDITFPIENIQDIYQVLRPNY